LATIEVIAANAVMAGCLPDYAPVVIAAVQACLDENLDLAEMQSPTNPVSPLVIVPGEGDMALLGHGSKFSACLAEGEELSPFEPYHVSRGWESTDSVVTVVGVDAPQAVVFLPIEDDDKSASLLLDLIARVIRNPAHVGSYYGNGSDVIVLNPDHAQVLDRAGFDREGIIAELTRRSTNELGRLRSLNPTVTAMSGSYREMPDETVVSACNTERLILLVAGGNGAYSWVMRSWSVGPHRGPSVMKRIQLDQQCDVISPQSTLA
jgi:hypothetical protein